MTNKSLSQRICEECGIKKKRVQNFTCHGCKYLINYECQRGDNPCNHYKYVYPDFENPANFKKLFNLKYGKASYETVIAKFCKCRFEVRSTTEFLEKFLNMLKYHKCWDTEQIIKAIREENWEV